MNNLPVPSDYSLMEQNRFRRQDLLKQAEQERLVGAYKSEAGSPPPYELLRVAQAVAAVVLGFFRS